MQQMTRRMFLGTSTLTGLALVSCGSSGSESTETETAPAETSGEATTVTGTYAIHVQGYDWGAGVDEVYLTLDNPLEAVSPEDFVVTEHKQSVDWSDETFPIVEVDMPRTVEDATLSDDGKTVTLKLACTPDEGSPFLFSMATMLNSWSQPYQLIISASEESTLGELAIDENCTGMTTSADAFALDTFEAADGVTYQYATFTPETDSTSLVVWLHGLGEGGTENTDPLVTLLANKVVALSEDEFQEIVGGAHVLVPQCPTYWMDADGKSGNYSGGAINADGTSFYSDSCEELIDTYAAKVGAEKIILAGCSNGGYMTMLLSIRRPDAYAGVVPICEALPDALITDDDIAALKDLPMYLVYSKDDPTVVPDLHEVPTIERLKAAGKGADTLHVSTTEHVVDLSGEVTDAEGNPYEYNGHWSWIYFDNNDCECDEDGLKAWDFIAECLK